MRDPHFVQVSSLIVSPGAAPLYSRQWSFARENEVTFAASNPQPTQSSPLQTILIVDDNANVTRALTSFLSGAGYRPIGCHSGAEALARLDSDTPAAAVVDIHLPDISGLILAQKLRDRLGPAMPIIIVSGDTSMETLNSLPHVGATYFFSKPLSATMLLQQLRTLLPAGPAKS
jgi:DNA-binding response OmpR family regulator